MKDTSGTYAYWLASPYYSLSVHLLEICHNGYIRANQYDSKGLGLRPLVYLPASVKLKESGIANLWNIDYGE